jgi:hypothetical protein
MCLKLVVEYDVGQVTLLSVNNSAVQFSEAFLLDHHNEEDPIVEGWYQWNILRMFWLITMAD